MILSVVTLLTACKLDPLQIDPCSVFFDNSFECHAVPINQPGKPQYDRSLNNGDICVTSDEYAALQKSFREIMRHCGENCQ